MAGPYASTLYRPSIQTNQDNPTTVYRPICLGQDAADTITQINMALRRIITATTGGFPPSAYAADMILLQGKSLDDA